MRSHTKLIAALAAASVAACSAPRESDQPSQGAQPAQGTPAVTAQAPTDSPATQPATQPAAQPVSATVAANLPAMTVYKSPTCGCCKNWVEHVQAAGFKVTVRDTADVTPIKQQYGVADSLHSCHTAIVNGYVVEGHVPAEDIARMLKERPKIAGLAVPGMPMGSPGMEVGGTKSPYEVIAFTKGGKSSVYAKH
ncbi:MAG: DUF411 domain-containing protein [Gemmatimonadaceae bacterium]